MATLKDKFTKGLTTINVKTNNFMEQNKINTYITTMEKEIVELKAQVGEAVFRQWNDGNFEIANIEGVLNTIKAKYAEIEVQRGKIEQIIMEEQQILGTMQGQDGMNRQGGASFCSKCGAQNSGEFKFCMRCGNQLQ